MLQIAIASFSMVPKLMLLDRTVSGSISHKKLLSKFNCHSALSQFGKKIKNPYWGVLKVSVHVQKYDSSLLIS